MPSTCSVRETSPVSSLVTGEAVALDLQLARFPSRAIAIAIDLAVEIGLLLLGSTVLGLMLPGVDETLGFALVLTMVVLVIVGVPTLIETLTHGRSLGKVILGLRVVRDDGGPARFRHAFVRALCAFFIDIWLTFGSVACISSLLSAKGKRVGDQFAGTVVIRERVPVRATATSTMVWMPPPLAGWAATADLSRVPDDLALMARQFLGRVEALAPATRASMAAGLAGQVAAYVAPPSPPGTPAEWYLAAVVAERSRRAHAALSAAPTLPATAPLPPQPSAAVPPPSTPPAPSSPPPSAPPPSGGGFSLPS